MTRGKKGSRNRKKSKPLIAFVVESPIRLEYEKYEKIKNDAPVIHGLEHLHDFGWGNGYVVIPNKHPFFKMFHDSHSHELGSITKSMIGKKMTEWMLSIPESNIGVNHFVDSPGGLTFSDAHNMKYLRTEMTYIKGREGKSKVYNWVVGFDTAHAWDTLEKWPKEAVMQATEQLAKDIEAFRNKRKFIKERKRILNGKRW